MDNTNDNAYQIMRYPTYRSGAVTGCKERFEQPGKCYVGATASETTGNSCSRGLQIAAYVDNDSEIHLPTIKASGSEDTTRCERGRS